MTITKEKKSSNLTAIKKILSRPHMKAGLQVWAAPAFPVISNWAIKTSTALRSLS